MCSVRRRKTCWNIGSFNERRRRRSWQTLLNVTSSGEWRTGTATTTTTPTANSKTDNTTHTYTHTGSGMYACCTVHTHTHTQAHSVSTGQLSTRQRRGTSTSQVFRRLHVCRAADTVTDWRQTGVPRQLVHGYGTTGRSRSDRETLPSNI